MESAMPRSTPAVPSFTMIFLGRFIFPRHYSSHSCCRHFMYKVNRDKWLTKEPTSNHCLTSMLQLPPQMHPHLRNSTKILSSSDLFTWVLTIERKKEKGTIFPHCIHHWQDMNSKSRTFSTEGMHEALSLRQHFPQIYHSWHLAASFAVHRYHDHQEPKLIDRNSWPRVG